MMKPLGGLRLGKHVIVTSYPKPINDEFNIPYEVVRAAEIVEDFFKSHNVKHWKLGGVQSRED